MAVWPCDQVGALFTTRPEAELPPDLPFTASLTSDPIAGFPFAARGNFRIQIDSPDLFGPVPPDLAIEFGGTLDAFDQHLQGQFRIHKMPDGTLTVLARDVGLTINAGGTRILELANGRGAFKLTAPTTGPSPSPGGLAGDLSIDLVNGPQIDGFEVSGTFGLPINQTNVAVTSIDGVPVNIPAGPFLRVTVDRGHLAVAGFAFVDGNFAFEQGPARSFHLSDGSDQMLDLVTVGASDVQLFGGVNGPYYTDLNGDGVIGTGFDANGNGTIDADETAETNPAALGLSMRNVEFGLALMSPATVSPTDRRSWLALTASVGEARIVGIEGITIAVSNF